MDFPDMALHHANEKGNHEGYFKSVAIFAYICVEYSGKQNGNAGKKISEGSKSNILVWKVMTHYYWSLTSLWVSGPTSRVMEFYFTNFLWLLYWSPKAITMKGQWRIPYFTRYFVNPSSVLHDQSWSRNFTVLKSTQQISLDSPTSWIKHISI